MPAKIIIKNVIHSNLAIATEDGEKVYHAISEHLDRNEPVVIDFEDITLVVSVFLNAAVGQLYSRYQAETLHRLLNVDNISNSDAYMLKRVVDYAKKHFENYKTTDVPA